MISIKGLLFILAAIGLASAKWPWQGLNICDRSICKMQVNRPVMDRTVAIMNVDTACTNLVGEDGKLVYVADERRHVCCQATNGDDAYRFDFDVHRNKGSDLANTLDFHSCVFAMQNMLAGGVWCNGDSGSQEYIVGNRMQIGLFDVSVSANPGLCAGTLPYSV